MAKKSEKNPKKAIGIRTGLTPLQKYELCCLREKHSTMKLADFAQLEECPKRPDGRPLATSSLSEHLKGWKKRVGDGPPEGPNANKQKARPAQYPFMEHFLALWVDAAEIACVPVTDQIIRSQATIVQKQLINAGVEENYESFEMSSGWLQNFKSRYSIGRLRRHGEAGGINEEELPTMRKTLAKQLEAFAPCDRYNCDESGLQYNLQPEYSNVRKQKGKQLAGTKKRKTRVTTFHMVNSDGSDKRKLIVVHRSKTPTVFRHNKVNINNLPVTYRHNKKSWMLTGLWYEFLRTIDAEMRIAGRHIALVTDNCPTHPPPDQPPQNYLGPSPPHLTHVTLIYLPPNTTSRLQPLDQGIIAAFKAAYRRRYAEQMVQYFNLHGAAPPKLDILQAIYLIADAWDSISTQTIANCWTKAAICNQTFEPVHLQAQHDAAQKQIHTFITEQHTSCKQSMFQIMPSGSASEDDYLKAFDDFFFFDEDNVNTTHEDFHVPDPAQLIQDAIASGFLSRSPDQLEDDLSDADAEGEEDHISEIPMITHDTAIHYLGELFRYLQALKVTEISTPTAKNFVVPEVLQKTRDLRSALIQYRDHTSRIHQTKIDGFFLRTPKQHQKSLLPSESVAGPKSRIPSAEFAQYIPDSSDEEKDEPASCVPTEWVQGTMRHGGIYDAYHQLLE